VGVGTSILEGATSSSRVHARSQSWRRRPMIPATQHTARMPNQTTANPNKYISIIGTGSSMELPPLSRRPVASGNRVATLYPVFQPETERRLNRAGLASRVVQVQLGGHSVPVQPALHSMEISGDRKSVV